MKCRISLTIDEDTILKVQNKLRARSKDFRNKSHLFEVAVNRLLEAEKLEAEK